MKDLTRLVVLAAAIGWLPGGSAASAADPSTSPEQAYLAGCGACHEPVQGPSAGVWYLRATRGPDKALLSRRDDLTADYIRTAVRQGLTVMPPLTRAEVTDAELEKIIDYLTRRERGQ